MAQDYQYGYSQGWYIGQRLLDEFVVERILGRGGMGSVYLVQRLFDGAYFAVKTLRTSSLTNPDDELTFMQELRTWIDLPEHPNIAACRFFRTISDRLAIFTDYVNGGNLQDWIRQKKLTTLPDILDVAIQFAWGLEAAHKHGFIHQDVKPANVLLNHDRTVKVTDFGLTRALYAAGIDSTSSSTASKSRLVSSNGMTLAYCSPEQSMMKKLNRRTDVWSFGVSVMEMFVGRPRWALGSMALAALEKYASREPVEPYPAMPEPLVELLRKCFQENPKERWDSMGALTDTLINIYQEITCHPYTRPKPMVPETAIRNIPHDRQAISGRSWDDPAFWLRKACEISGQPASKFDDIIPERKGSRKAQAVADLEVYETAQKLIESILAKTGETPGKCLAQLVIQKAKIQESIGDLPGAVASYDQAVSVYSKLFSDTGELDISNELAGALAKKALVILYQEQPQEALILIDEAIRIRESLVNENKRDDFSNFLASTYINKAAVLFRLNRMDECILYYDRVIAIRERLVYDENQTQLADYLARVYINKSSALTRMDNLTAAKDFQEKAMKLFEKLVQEDGRNELKQDLAIAYMNAAICQGRLNEYSKAITQYHQALEILEHLIHQQDRLELLPKLIMVYNNQSIALRETGANNEALQVCQNARKLLTKLIQKEGQTELLSGLAITLTNQAMCHRNLKQIPEALAALKESSELYRHLMEKEHQQFLKPQLENNLSLMDEIGRENPDYSPQEKSKTDQTPAGSSESGSVSTPYQ